MPPPCHVLAPARATLSCSSPAACRWAFITTCAVSLCPLWLCALHHHAPQDNRHALPCRQHAHSQCLSRHLVWPVFALRRAFSSGWSCCTMQPLVVATRARPSLFMAKAMAALTLARLPAQPTCPLAASLVAPVLACIHPRMGPLEQLAMPCMTLSGPLMVVTRARPSLFVATATVASRHWRALLRGQHAFS
jgi:hypothetical protein